MNEYTWVPATTSYSDLPMPSAPSTLNRLAFGNARNDGIQRLCGVTSAGELCEWTYSCRLDARLHQFWDWPDV